MGCETDGVDDDVEMGDVVGVDLMRRTLFVDVGFGAAGKDDRRVGALPSDRVGKPRWLGVVLAGEQGTTVKIPPSSISGPCTSYRSANTSLSVRGNPSNSTSHELGMNRNRLSASKYPTLRRVEFGEPLEGTSEPAVPFSS